MPAAARFYVEVVKLLLQVAWGDHRVDTSEALALLGLARSWGVSEAEAWALRERLTSGEPLPAPDLGLLRHAPDKVLEAARAFAMADGRVNEEEAALLEQVASMLGSGKP